MAEIKYVKPDDKFEDVLKKIGLLAGVGENWYEIGDAEKTDDGETRYGIYAKTETIAEKVGEVLDGLICKHCGAKMRGESHE